MTFKKCFTCSVLFGTFATSFGFKNDGLVSAAIFWNCWPFNLVPFVIQPGFTLYQQKYIKEQIDKINKNTCLSWSDMVDTEAVCNNTNYVRFVKETSGSCGTSTTYPIADKGLEVEISLPDHCFEGRYVLHEIVHALGFDHEHQRLDRNCYVWVSDSVRYRVNYRIESRYFIPNLDEFPYDKQSVMHYRRSGDLKTLNERFYEWEALGNKEERLTDLDVWKIQYRFCGRPHYCEVHPQHCRDMERQESDKNCSAKFTR